MLVQKEFLTRLREFGLNTYESRLWIALLSRGTSTAGELSDIANVPRSRSYDVLEALQRKGFINVKQGKPIRYVAVPPEEVLERRKNIVKEMTEKRIGLINELTSHKLLSELMSLYQKGSNIGKEQLIATIRGSQNIQHHLESMLKSVTKSISIYATSKSLIPYLNLLVTQLQKAKSRSIDIKIALQINKESAMLVSALSNFAVIKHANKKARLFIVDKKEVLFMLFDSEEIHQSYDIAVWLCSEYLASALDSAFEKEFSVLKKAEV